MPDDDDDFRLFDDGPVLRPYNPATAHAKAIARGADCPSCPLYGCHRGPVMGTIVSGSPLISIGEAPGKHEVSAGMPFVGRSGYELNAALEHGGLKREQISVTNTLLCQPPEGLKPYVERHARAEKRRAAAWRAEAKAWCADAEAAKAAGTSLVTGSYVPRPSPLDCCRPRLDRDIEESGAKVILAVGGYALKMVAERYGLHYGSGKDKPGVATVATIKNQHGSPIDLREKHGVIVAPALHPAFAMRGHHEYKHVIHDDIARAARIAVRGDIDWRRPKYLVFPTIEQVESATDWMLHHRGIKGCEVTEDIETDSAVTQTARIRCVGLYCKTPNPNPLTDDVELVVIVPFLWRDGRQYWPTPQLAARAAAAVRRVNERCDLVGHNIMGFDVPVLHRHGMFPERAKLCRDTMLAHHDTHENDLPHSLSLVMRRKFECPMHKHDVDHKAADNVDDDYALHFYCGDDVLVTGRLWPELRQDILNCGTQHQFKIDSMLAPIASQMGDLGLVIDERRRGELSLTFNRLCRDLERKFQTAATKTGARATKKGEPINPGSPQQVASWLFDHLQLTPTLTPQGHEWDEGDDTSTSTPALLQLLDQGVDAEVAGAIDALIEYRSCDKLRGSYLDNAKVSYDRRLSNGDRAPAVVIDGETILPNRQALSLLHATWKVHVVPTGRWASAPNCQNWPARAFAPYLYEDDGRTWQLDAQTGAPLRGEPTNLRELVVCPPGHVLVGSDLMQIEQRLYALFSGDQFLLAAFAGKDRDGKPLDPHLLNAATLFCEVTNPNMTDIMDTYHVLKLLPKGKLKYVRTVAKRVQYLECLAEGTPVLTDRGNIPIEHVEPLDKVWDGVEWVTHDGVACFGAKEVITHDGITATPDHLVWLRDGRKRPLELAASRGEALARTGCAGQALRFVAGTDHGLPDRFVQKSHRALQWLWHRSRALLGQSGRGQITGMQQLFRDAGGHTAVAPLQALVCQATLYESATSTVCLLRWAWHRVSLLLDCCSSPLGRADLQSTRPEVRDRSYRQRRTLRALEPTPRAAADQPAQSRSMSRTVRLHLRPGGLAVREAHDHDFDLPWDDQTADPGASAGDDPDQGSALPQVRCVVRVYDVINAGPRHRYTANDRLVSNSYGGEEDKLFQTLAGERDKATGVRTFPSVTPADAKRWHLRWHQLHPETKQWQDAVARAVKEHGYVADRVHRRKRFFPGGPSKKNAPPNHTIQGSAAALMNDAILEIAEAIPFGSWSPWTGLCLQVHDYAGVYAPRARAEEAAEIIRVAMYSELEGLPLPGDDVLVTDNWAQQG